MATLESHVTQQQRDGGVTRRDVGTTFEAFVRA